MTTPTPSPAAPSPYAPWVPPFRYNYDEHIIVDSKRRLIIDIIGYLPGKTLCSNDIEQEQAEIIQDAIGQRIANLMNQDAGKTTVMNINFACPKCGRYWYGSESCPPCDRGEQGVILSLSVSTPSHLATETVWKLQGLTDGRWCSIADGSLIEMFGVKKHYESRLALSWKGYRIVRCETRTFLEPDAKEGV